MSPYNSHTSTLALYPLSNPSHQKFDLLTFHHSRTLAYVTVSIDADKMYNLKLSDTRNQALGLKLIPEYSR